MSMKERRSTAGMAMALAALSASGLRLDPEAIGSAHKILDEVQAADEKAFLATLKGEPKRIWARRIANGLSSSELAFIRSKLKQS